MRYQLRLYVTGRTAQSQRAIANVKEMCEARLKGVSEVEVIDVLVNPRLAERDKILATPTLVRHVPHPVRKVVGDLSDGEKVLSGLGIFYATDASSETAR